jgi:hypothetical protein
MSVPEKPREKFKKPTLEEVKLTAAKIGLPDSEASHFLNFYESKGWFVGRNPMKSWSHALSNWKVNYESRKYERSNGKPATAVGEWKTADDYV